MSEVPDDAALETAALAAMDAAEVADKGARAAEAEAAPAAQAKPDSKARIETVAAAGGWSGKDDWKGDPDEWLDAPEFILKAAGEVLPSMRKSLEKRDDEIKGLKAAVNTAIRQASKADERAYARAKAEIEADLAYAKANNDVDGVEAATLAKAELERVPPEPQQQGDHPDFAAWHEANEWYRKDKPLSAAFDALCAEVAEEGYSTPKVGLKEATNRLKEQFPDKFAEKKPPENPNRRLPGAVEGGGTVVRRPGGKSFSDMPRDAQEMCLDLMKLSKAITKENYAAQHFADQGKS